MSKNNTSYLCACGGRCEGSCAAEHLHRERKSEKLSSLCPAAIEVKDEQKTQTRIEED